MQTQWRFLCSHFLSRKPWQHVLLSEHLGLLKQILAARVYPNLMKQTEKSSLSLSWLASQLCLLLLIEQKLCCICPHFEDEVCNSAEAMASLGC